MDKADLRREMCAFLKTIADSIESKSRRIRDHLMAIDFVRQTQQSQRLMGFVSKPLEVDIIPFFANGSMIVPCCENNEIVPFRVFSLDELEPSGTLQLLEPKFSIRQEDSRRILPEQIDTVLVPGLAFDRFGNRLGRGKGYYDRFLRWLPTSTLTIGLAFDGMIHEHLPHNEHDHPVKMVVTEEHIYRPSPQTKYKTKATME